MDKNKQYEEYKLFQFLDACEVVINFIKSHEDAYLCILNTGVSQPYLYKVADDIEAARDYILKNREN